MLHPVFFCLARFWCVICFARIPAHDLAAVGERFFVLESARCGRVASGYLLGRRNVWARGAALGGLGTSGRLGLARLVPRVRLTRKEASGGKNGRRKGDIEVSGTITRLIYIRRATIVRKRGG